MTNVKVLGEGVDVPELEGVIFYDPRTSTTDMVQAIGRISRKQPGAAKTAYVVVPLVLKRDENREAVLKTSADWKTLYQTIATLRSIDEAFVSQIECAVVEAEASTNRKPPRPGGGDDTNEDPPLTAGIESIRVRGADPDLTTAIRRQIGPAVVKICGTKLYWDSWGRSIAQTYRAVRTRLEGLYETSEKTRRAVDGATETLHRAIHRGIDTPQTLRMLAQHQISDRVFRALFGEYYTELGRTPAARAVQAATEALNGTGLGNETEALLRVFTRRSRPGSSTSRRTTHASICFAISTTPSSATRSTRLRPTRPPRRARSPQLTEASPTPRWNSLIGCSMRQIGHSGRSLQRARTSASSDLLRPMYR